MRARARAGAAASVLLTGAGLAWLDRGPDLDAARSEGVDVALCSRSARDAGRAAATSPPGVRWSSLVAWLGEGPADALAWAAFP